jgi:peptide/nickel transport system substrate-binding protein
MKDAWCLPRPPFLKTSFDELHEDRDGFPVASDPVFAAVQRRSRKRKAQVLLASATRERPIGERSAESQPSTNYDNDNDNDSKEKAMHVPRLRTLIRMAAAIPLVLAGLLSPTVASAQDSTIIKAIAGDTQTIDPRLNLQPRSSEMVANMYDQLVTYETYTGADGQLYSDVSKPVGLLAESWSTSEDGLVWTWKMREGVLFHSGREMTAEDVKWAFERDAKVAKPGSFNHRVVKLYDAGNEDRVTEAIKVIDRYTLEMRFETATPFVPQVFANAGVTVYDSELMKANATPEDPWAKEFLKQNDAGTGPFMLEVIEPGVQVVLKRFDKYFRGPAAVERIIYRVVPSAADRAILLENNEIQFAEELDFVVAKQLSDKGTIKLLDFATNDQLSLMMSPSKGPTADPLVRQAISYAIPREDIVDVVYYGFAQPGGGPIPVGSPGYDPNAPFYKTDIAKAKELLASSTQPSGFDITLTIDSSRATWEQSAVLIQGALGELGINVTIEKLAPANFNDKFFAGEIPFFIWQGNSWVDEPTYHFLLWWEPGSYGNKIGYENPQVLEKLARAKVSTDQAERAQLFSEVQQLMLEDAPAAWIAQPNLVIATTAGVTGYIARPDQITRFYTVKND